MISSSMLPSSMAMYFEATELILSFARAVSGFMLLLSGAGVL